MSNPGVGLSNRHSLGWRAEQIINHDGTGINIVVGSGRTVDDHGSSDTITVLGENVRVVPAGSVLVGLERVCTGLARGNSAFSDTWNTVLVVGTNLGDTVPMDGGGVVGHLVGDGDLDLVTPVALKKRSWNLSVDSKSKTVETIVVEGSVGDDPVGGAGLAGAWVLCVVVSVDAVLSAPLVSAGRRVAASFFEMGERFGHVGCAGTSVRASAVATATLSTVS